MRVDLYLLQVCIQTNPFLLFVGVITLANLKGKSIVPFLELEPDVLSTQKTPKNLV
jgi:hypothetical protein